MELTLEAAESELVHRVLTQHLSDLRMEITDTDNFNWRQDMKREEECIKGLLARIEKAAPALADDAARA